MIIYPLLLTAYLLTAAMVFTILAIREKDLVKAVVYSAVQSIAYAIAFAVLLAPDILLVYIAVGLGIYPVIILYTISRTKRFEKHEQYT